MKCPECVAEGERSTIEIGDSIRTLMFTHDYFDEDGRFHHHDPNTITTSYYCSRGHRWSAQRVQECETCNTIREEEEAHGTIGR